MKGQLVRKLSKKYLLHDLPGFTVKGHLLYDQNIDFLLSGLCFESSAFSQNSFTIDVFVQPLFIPATYLYFNFGDRIGLIFKNRDYWWEYDENNEVQIMDEIHTAITTFGIPYLKKRNFLKGFITTYKNFKPTENPHTIEGIAYSYILVEDYGKAQKHLSSLGKRLINDAEYYQNASWIVEMQKRVILMLSHLENKNYQNAKDQLSQWRDFTLSSLGLEGKYN